MPELNRNEIIDSNLLHTILSNRRMTRYIVSIPDRAEYILKNLIVGILQLMIMAVLMFQVI